MKKLIIGLLILSLLLVGCSDDYRESFEYRKGYNAGYADMRNNIYDTCNETGFDGNYLAEEDIIIINNKSGCFVLIYDEDGLLSRGRKT